MCGFTGLWTNRESDFKITNNANWRLQIEECLIHRGPDSSSITKQDDIFVNFRRLAIVDPQSGMQPIFNENKTIWCLLNGEIYNYKNLRSQLRKKHQFQTESDAEVIVHLYEEFELGFLDKIEGEYSIVLADTIQKKLIIARDPFGTKPLYYYSNHGRFGFSSELKSLLLLPACPNDLSWSDFSSRINRTVGFTLAQTKPLTYVENVQQIRPGHYIEICGPGDFAEKPYWNLFSQKKDFKGNLRAASEEYLRLFNASVETRLDTNLPTGLFLSGGLDSCGILASAAKLKKNIISFTIDEKSSRQTGDYQSAVDLATTLKYPIHPLKIDFKTLAKQMNFNLELFQYFVWAYDHPIFKYEWIVKNWLYSFAKQTEPNLKINLLGQGADEFAGGYSKATTADPTWSWQKYINGPAIASKQFKQFSSRFNLNPTFDLLIDDNISKLHPFDLERSYRWNWMPEYSLWHEDRSAMSHSIENRVPFLDKKLVEFLMSIPEEKYEQFFFDKEIERSAFEKILPTQHTRRKKIGFLMSDRHGDFISFLIEVGKLVYPEFKNEYINKHNTQFKASAYDELATSALIGKGGIDNLLSLMSIDIFTHSLREPNYFSKFYGFRKNFHFNH